MNDFKQRQYHRIFTGTNQVDGHDKIYLGYEAETVEITFKKDTTTYFHVPYFTTVKNLIPDQIINDGALPGPIPALADRIFQKQTQYGDTTPWGTSTNGMDGRWLCSWLCSISGESPVWLDRYYNPGRIAYDEALQGPAMPEPYIKVDPPFVDRPSTMQLVPGVYYQYFHNGEKTAKRLVETFAGDDKTKLTLSLQNWSATPTDESIYQNKCTINGFKDSWSIDLKTPGVVDRNVLSFNNNDFIDVRVAYTSGYNNENEFTVNFWVQNDNWDTATSTQLVGNFNFGGYGVFFDSLKNYPFFIIPETFYGHLFYFNQEGFVYLDKNSQPVAKTTDNPLLSGSSSPIVVGINGDDEAFILDSGVLNSVYKVNHLGDTLAIPRTIEGTPIVLSGAVKNMVIDKDSNCRVFTTTGEYLFDKDLFLQAESKFIPTPDNPNPYDSNLKYAFDKDGILFSEACNDIKFDNNNNKWTIGLDGKLYYNDTELTNLANCTNLAVDPNNNIWVLYDDNNIAKINAETQTIIKAFEIGLNSNKQTRNISFIHIYDRTKNFQTWYAIIYSSFDQNMYLITLDGELERLIFLPDELNIQLSPPSKEDKSLLKFNCVGDFTGYEWKRIFNKVLYDNKPQIKFKVAAKKLLKNSPISTFTLSVPVQYFSDKTWHLVTCTYEKQEMKTYIDTYLRGSKVVPGNYLFSYLRQNDLYIGTPTGKFTNLNTELNSKALIFNGYLDNIKIYNYAIKPQFLPTFIRERIIGQNLIWNLPTTSIQYIEQIDRFFKHKLPGSKSTFFKLKVSGLNITDPNTRKLVEDSIRATVEKLKPSYAELLTIEWVEG